ncbi:MAG: primosomal protein N' [Gammaproteobacteria bacterium]|nr:MAG: primosomal protein N' [Gammaproteobacteria bacterium]
MTNSISLTQSPLNHNLFETTENPSSEEFVVLGISINVPLRRLFDYKISVDNAVEAKVGMRVEVSFSNRIKIGVINKIGASSNLPLEKIKPINRLLDDTPLVNNNLIKLSQWMLNYYHAAPCDVWNTILPNALLKGEKTELARESFWRLTKLGLELYQAKKVAKNAVKQQLAMACLFEVENKKNTGLVLGLRHSQISQFNLSLTTLKTLAGKKWIERIFDATYKKDNKLEIIKDKKPIIKLNDQQDFAVTQVSKQLDIYKTWLLFGVTASGKTEVYLRIIEAVLLQGKQALVLVPEIGLTPQTVSRFERRFNTGRFITENNHVEIAMMHSGMTDKQRLQVWLKAQTGQVKIIIGTRSALFIPLKNPGIIIIDEEHDTSFKQQQGLRYSARDTAMVRASIEKIPVLLASATPSIETLINVEKKKITQLDLTQKALTSVEVKCRVIDMKKQPIKQGLSFHLIDSIQHHLKQKGQILLFLNRRGYAPVLLCHQCGWSSECKRCERHFTFHGNENSDKQHLQCHHCGSSRRAPKQCPKCQCDEMIPIGLGTERLEETIKTLFPSARVQRIDRDTTRKKSAMDGFVTSIKSGEIDILIGTQMLAKGHHFPNITLVGLVDMDGALYSSDFRAPEYAAQLITQVSGRAGRAENKGEVIIQTHLADHPMLSILLNSGYRSFAKTAINERKEACLPPISYNALIQAEAPNIGMVKNFLQEVKDILKQVVSEDDGLSDIENLELLGPVPAVYTKKAGKFRYQLYIQTNQRRYLHQLLKGSIPAIESLKTASRVRWRLEVDPIGD